MERGAEKVSVTRTVIIVIVVVIIGELGRVDHGD